MVRRTVEEVQTEHWAVADQFGPMQQLGLVGTRWQGS